MCLICHEGVPRRLGRTEGHLGWNILGPNPQCKHTRFLSPHSHTFATQVDTAETSLLITEPYFNLPNIQQVYDQFVFEEYEFQSYLCSTRASSSLLSGQSR
jgi:actin-related protein